MLIQLSDTELVDELCVHYGRSGFEASPMGGGMVALDRLDAPSPDQAAREIRLHLLVWEVLHPETKAEIVG
jgi:hypothetical protein